MLLPEYGQPGGKEPRGLSFNMYFPLSKVRGRMFWYLGEYGVSLYKQSIQTKSAFFGGKIKGNLFTKNRETQDTSNATSGFKGVMLSFSFVVISAQWNYGQFSSFFELLCTFQLFHKEHTFLIIKSKQIPSEKASLQKPKTFNQIGIVILNLHK